MVYSFSVQLFFFISGFLFHVEPDSRVFWRKNKDALIIPYFIWGTLRLLTYNLRQNSLDTFVHSFTGLLLGCNNFLGIRGCGELWFVATLLFLKIIYQHCKGKNIRKVLFVVCIVGAVAYRKMIYHSSIEFMGAAIGNVFVAYPFFYLGHMLATQQYKSRVMSIADKLEGQIGRTCVLAVFVLAIMCVVDFKNGVVFMVYGQYGNNLFLFLLFGLIGIVFTFFVAIFFCKVLNINIAHWINIGSIMILAMHTQIINVLRPLLVKLSDGNPYTFEIALVVVSLGVLLLFVPVTNFFDKYLPITLGYRK